MTNKELDIMYYFILKEMEFSTWYPVKSEKAKQLIMHLMQYDNIDNVEFNEDYSKVRKVELNFKTK